jgi:hypothetical protein
MSDKTIFVASATIIAMLYCGSHAADRRSLKSVASLKDECSALIVMGKDTKCDGTITNQSWSDTRTSFTFLAPQGAVAVTFSGLGSNQVKLDADTVVQPVDTMVLTYGGKTETSMPWVPAGSATLIREKLR